MARRIKAFGRQKTIATADVGEVLSFGKEAHFMRRIPVALAIGLLGLVMLFLRDDGDVLASLVLIAAGFGYVAFALWRRLNPGAPTLVLSPDGIRYRVAGQHAVDIPWDEVEAVDSADIHVRARGLVGSTQRDVPVVMVSEAFYRERPHYVFTPKDGQVRLAIFASVLDQAPDELREAIERRWRAFSNHPNARLPPAPRPAPRRRMRLTRGQKRAAWIVAAIVAAPLLWYRQWAFTWLAPDLPDGFVRQSLNELLGGAGVPARHEDGAMGTVLRADVEQVVAQQCRRRIVRDETKAGLTPAYEAEYDCVADLRLTSGTTAVAAIGLVVQTNEHHRTRVLVPVAPGLEDARQQICAMRACP